MRGRRFTDARALLDDLLDRSEKGVGRPIAYADRQGFASIRDGDLFDRAVLAAEEAGLVSVGYGTGDRRSEIQLVRLLDPAGLYLHLGRASNVSAVEAARTIILAELDLHPAIREEIGTAFSAWGRRSTWCGMGWEAADEVRTAVVLAQAIVDRRYEGLDYRTFSRRTVKDSKALERLEVPVIRLLGNIIDIPSGIGPRAAMAAIGLDRIGQPILLAGPVSLGDASMEIPTAYVGFQPKDIGHLRIVRPPEYVLTIENLVSFTRHVVEADPERRGLAIYVGGYPSLGIQKALQHLATILPSATPFFHWSDIDPDGVTIHRTVERALGRPCHPHLMSIDLAEELGTKISSDVRYRKGKGADDDLAVLDAYFRRPEAKTLEQEEIDPKIPRLPLRSDRRPA